MTESPEPRSNWLLALVLVFVSMSGVVGLVHQMGCAALFAFADAKGEGKSYPEADVGQESKGETSLMPENFGHVLPEPELADLLTKQGVLVEV